MLRVNELRRHYRKFDLGPLSLKVEPGCAMGLVGANGAGKTTLFRCIMGSVRSQHGEVWVGEQEATAIDPGWRQDIGYVGDATPLFDGWTGARNLGALSRFYPNWSAERATAMAERLNLDLTQRVRHYSTGQRSKLAIVLALSHAPKLLLLDEPTAGLDALSQDVFLELLFDAMAVEGTALLYATHHISEIAQLVDRLAFIHEGRLVREEIKEDLTQAWRQISFRHEGELNDIPHVVASRQQSPYFELVSDDADATLDYLRQQGISGCESSRMTMERIAIEILKRSA